MAAEVSGLDRIERAIYIVGSLVLILLGVQSIAITGLNVYDTVSGTFFLDSHAWVTWGVELLIGFSELAAGVFLAFLGRRATARLGSSAP